jgi:hypothetical protein
LGAPFLRNGRALSPLRGDGAATRLRRSGNDPLARPMPFTSRQFNSGSIQKSPARLVFSRIDAAVETLRRSGGSDLCAPSIRKIPLGFNTSLVSVLIAPFHGATSGVPRKAADLLHRASRQVQATKPEALRLAESAPSACYCAIETLAFIHSSLQKGRKATNASLQLRLKTEARYERTL